MKTRWSPRFPISICALALALAPGHSHAVTRFYALGDLSGGLFDSRAFGVSEDGSVVVGYSASAASAGEAFRWTRAGGMKPLDNIPEGVVMGPARDVSADGRVVAARVINGSQSEAVRWTAGVGIESLGDLPGGETYSLASGVSADGSVVVGQSSSANGTEPFRWTAAGGMKGLGGLSATPYQLIDPPAVSADGSIVVGGTRSTVGSRQAFVWTTGSAMFGIGFLNAEAGISHAGAVSANGSVVVGLSWSSGYEAMRWSSGTGMVGLGDLPGGDFSSYAQGVSADGSVIVGYGTSALGLEAVRWDSGMPIRTIKAWLQSRGIEIPGWTLRTVDDISTNGRHIVGYGVNPSGANEAWLVSVLPDPPTLALKGPRVSAKRNGKFTLRGTADDDADVVKVEYQIGGKGAWKKARGTTGWKLTAKLKEPGRKTKVSIRSVDEDGQTSRPAIARVLPAARATQ